MHKKENNYAFIDSQNLNLGTRSDGWVLDFKRFRVYLADKHYVETAYMFMGYVRDNERLYEAIQKAGFICIFKPTLVRADGTTKGNRDAELVLQAMIDFFKYDEAVIVTGDGDFYCLARYLLSSSKLNVIMIPNRRKFSALLRIGELRPYLRYMNELKEKLCYQKETKEKSP